MEQAKGRSLVQGHRLSNIKVIGWLLILGAYLNMNCIDYVGEKLATRIFFFAISIAFIFLSGAELKTDKYKWFFRSVFECSCYSLIDEALDRANIIDWWEIVGGIITFGGNFIFQYKASIKRYITYFKKSRR